MKKSLKYLLALLPAAALCACSSSSESKSAPIITSFYPIYNFTLAVTEGTPLGAANLAKTQAGCLHDYQLTSGNMRSISGAETFIINGAGMEDGFINKAIGQNPRITLIDSAENVALSETSSHNHGGEGHDEEHGGEYNSHVWTSVENAKKQTETIASELSAKYPQYSEIFIENADSYCKTLSQIDVPDFSGLDINVVSFHEAFAYLLNDVGINVTETVEIDENTVPSAKRLAHIADSAENENISAVICADDGGLAFVETVSRELGVPCIVLDPVTSGPDDKNGYIDAQIKNFETLKEAFLIEKP
ncbi:zinc ABC transporter substrate-binding protein [Anaerotignum faecicola]|nr:zinc ABC transporter substrate-binding protein [Anaerotignum faecicola]